MTNWNNKQLKREQVLVKLKLNFKPVQEGVAIFVLSLLLNSLTPGVCLEKKELGKSDTQFRSQILLHQFVDFYLAMFSKLMLSDNMVRKILVNNVIVITVNCSNNLFRRYPSLFNVIKIDRKTNAELIIEISGLTKRAGESMMKII